MRKDYKIIIRDLIRIVVATALIPIYLPHVLLYWLKKVQIDFDTERYGIYLTRSKFLQFITLLHNDRYFRTLFYHRIGPVLSMLIGWWRSGDRYFVISKTTKIGGGAYFAHPFATEINAKSIGRNFTCRHLTTLGNKKDGDNENRPTIGNNVTLGVNVTILGSVSIGDNVIIGAGSVVVKDIPSNCVAVGNPAKVIKSLPPID